jgi:histidyl-tRNA synthetase
MRPEMTPTLARMVAARERDFKKPMKWFCCPQFFRYEKQQRGRLREFYQFNADIIGEGELAADAETISLVIDILREFGFTSKDFVVRISDRYALLNFVQTQMGQALGASELQQFFEAVDKMDRQDESLTNQKLQKFNTTVQKIRDWAASTREKLFEPALDHSLQNVVSLHKLLHEQLAPRGFLEYVDVDFSIVRGLAYYTGFVFEIFDRTKKERALAGGGRYDNLLRDLSDGKISLPALGFGMGDVVLANLINDTPHAKAKMDAWIAQNNAADIYVVIAKEERRENALAIVQQLRDAGLRVDFPLTDAKVGKQFQTAEHLGARLAVLVGDEWPQVKIKTLATREETLVPADQLAAHLAL